MLPISEAAKDMIVYYEVGGKSYYEKYLTKPTVPAWQSTSSGVTIGFGFDCGYNSPQQIQAALEGIVPQEQIDLLKKCSGYKGRSAYYNALPKVKYNVRISYDQAEQIFERDSLPRFTKLTKDAFDLAEDRLHPDSNGALVSLVFNRGSLIDYSDRRKEMAWIKYNISIGKEEKVPDDIRHMKRLWSYSRLRGLHLRRDAEAKMFQKGLDETQ